MSVYRNHRKLYTRHPPAHAHDTRVSRETILQKHALFILHPRLRKTNCVTTYTFFIFVYQGMFLRYCNFTRPRITILEVSETVVCTIKYVIIRILLTKRTYLQKNTMFNVFLFNKVGT